MAQQARREGLVLALVLSLSKDEGRLFRGAKLD
jgi:hypothetical protein